jgi:hypothetical protein
VLLGTELLKLGTTRTPWLLGAAVPALTALVALQPVIRAGRDGAPSLGTALAALAVLDAMSRGALAALVLGALVATTEFRHKTVGLSLLQAPDRVRLLLAKAMTAALVGLALGLSALAVVLAVGLGSRALRWELANPDITLHGLGLVLTYPLYALLGVAVGALLSGNQPLAVILPLAWLLGLEPLALSGLPQPVSAWSVGGLTAALQNSGTLPFVLPVWAGGAALLGLVLLLLLAAAHRLLHTDLS